MSDTYKTVLLQDPEAPSTKWLPQTIGDQVELGDGSTLEEFLGNLAAVATSGDYDDLENKPTIPTTTNDLTNNSGFITINNTDNIIDWYVPSSDMTHPHLYLNDAVTAAFTQHPSAHRFFFHHKDGTLLPSFEENSVKYYFLNLSQLSLTNGIEYELDFMLDYQASYAAVLILFFGDNFSTIFPNIWISGNGYIPDIVTDTGSGNSFYCVTKEFVIQNVYPYSIQSSWMHHHTQIKIAKNGQGNEIRWMLI